jgi:hypothetical protein
VHEKLSHIVHEDFLDYFALEDRLDPRTRASTVSASRPTGMAEEPYRRVTHDYPLAVARTLARLNAGLAFCNVSGAGPTARRRGRLMWARVKGPYRERAARAVPTAYMFPPRLHPPSDGIDRARAPTASSTKPFGFLFPSSTRSFRTS